MKNSRNNEVADRRAVSATAKAALLNAFRAARVSADPAKIAKRVERAAIAAARNERRVERERVKLEDRNRIETEVAERQAALEASAAAETTARETAEKARIGRVIADEAARKAERDRRYANRKARQA